MVKETFVSNFQSRAYDNINDIAETIMNPANCLSSTVKHSIKDNINFAHPEPVYVYTDIIKPNLVGDPYVRLLNSLHLPRVTIYLITNCTNQWNSPI
jgi:hypothetical protein